MKLAVAFLLTCAVLASSDVQKRQAFFWAAGYQPSQQQHYFAPQPQYYRLPYGVAKPDGLTHPGEDTAIRTNPFGYAHFKSDNEATPRFFFNNGPGYIQTTNGGLVAPSGGNVYYMNRLLRPVYVTSTVTISNAVPITCIPRNNFASGSENNICAGFRKRREVIELLDQLDDGIDITPSNVQQVDVTPAPRMIDFGSHLRSAPASQDVMSSQVDELAPREKRFLNFLAPTITVTAFSITNTTITKTLQLLTSGASSQLGCRPSSVSVC